MACARGDEVHVGMVHAARAAIAGVAVKTPLIASRCLDVAAKHPVFLKLETLQPVGAFKVRGAANALSRLDAEQRARGVVCCSTGNHGRGVAYAGRRLGVKATVCLSSLVPDVKVRAIEALGATVVRVGRSQDEAQHEVGRLVREEGLTDIPPFDHPAVVAGQGTIALEILEDRPEIETILVPLSGGGLIGGIALAPSTEKNRSSGFLVYYSPYAVGPYAEGDYVVYVPWTAFGQALSPRGAALFGGQRPADDSKFDERQ